MYIFAGIVLMFMPFLFLIFVAKNTSELLKIEENIKLPDNISLLNSINTNYFIIKQSLLEEHKFTENEALKICNTFKKTQYSMLCYIAGGFIQFFGIVVYSIMLFFGSDIAILYRENSNQLATYIAMVIIACITFWIFYGSQLFEYMGLTKAKNAIDSAISALFKAQDKLQNKKEIMGSKK
jgi:hypothetical protein